MKKVHGIKSSYAKLKGQLLQKPKPAEKAKMPNLGEGKNRLSRFQT